MAKAITPPPDRDAWEWAEAHREIPKGAAEPGPFDTSRAIWVRGITRACGDPKNNHVTGLMGSQMSKSDGVILNVIGWKLCDDPQPILYVGPTQKNAESLSADRLSKMIDQVPSLSAGLARGHANKVAEKFIHGVRLGIAWAGSATELASHPASIVCIDERDRMTDIKGEGDVNTLAEARVATYDGLIITVTTPLEGNVESKEDPITGLDHWQLAPTEDISSPSWQLWQEGSRHEFAVPCHHKDCYEYFIPKTTHLYMPEGKPKKVYQEAAVICPHCGAAQWEERKTWSNKRGVFAAPGQRIRKYAKKQKQALVFNPDDETGTLVDYGTYLEVDPDDDALSFWVSGLCSPWRSVGHRARQLRKAELSGSSGRVQAAMNTGMGELYRPRVNAPDWQLVANLRQDYRMGELVDAGQIMTMGVDVQKRSLYYSVRIWGANRSSWLVEHGQIEGDTRYDEVWDTLGDIMLQPWGHDEIRIYRAFIDTGYNPTQDFMGNYSDDDVLVAQNKIHDFCRKHRRIAKPARGMGQQAKPIRQAPIDIYVNGNVIPNGLQVWHLDTDMFKTQVYDWIELPEETRQGRWVIPIDATDEYCKQVVAESRTTTDTGKVVWKRTRKDNHWLDCEMMNAALAHQLKLSRLSDETWGRYRTTAEEYEALQETIESAMDDKQPTDTENLGDLLNG